MSKSVETVYTCDRCKTMSDVEFGEDAANKYYPNGWTRHRATDSFSNKDLCVPCTVTFQTMIEKVTAGFFNTAGTLK